MLPDARAILDPLPELALLVEVNGTIAAMNRICTRALGGDANELVGRSLFELLETPADHAALSLRRWAGSRCQGHWSCARLERFRGQFGGEAYPQ